MKTMFTKKVDPAMAKQIAGEGIKTVMAEFFCHHYLDGDELEKYTRHFDSCRVRHGQFWVRPDWTGYEIGFIFHNTFVVELYENTCGGNFHSLRIDKTGVLTVTHDGRRRSYPGCFPLPEQSIFWGLNNAHSWELVEYKTSEPEWAAFSGLLRGRHGIGPENSDEAEQFAASEREREIRKIFAAIGKDFPQEIFLSVTGEWLNYRHEPISLPKFTALDYRRASAIGVKI